jgi:hypothetical protein
MGVEIQLFEVDAYRSDYCVWGWMKSEVKKKYTGCFRRNSK